MTYIIINTLIWLTTLVSGGRLVAADADLAEYWTWNPKGGTPPWFVRAFQNHGRFWSAPERSEIGSNDETGSGNEGDDVIAVVGGVDKQVVGVVEREK